MPEFARLEVTDGVATLWLDRPKALNAINAQLQQELLDAAREADARDDIAAVVLYGGERAFAAGADVKEFTTWDYAAAVKGGRLLQEFTTAVARIGKPTVSAITGFALGGGLELALATDLRFLADNAKVGQPEILLGIIPGAGGTQRLSRLVGPAKAKDLIYTGRMVRADEALAIGLADQVHPADEVYAKAVAWASQFVGGPAIALRAAKNAIDRGLDVDLTTGLDLERAEFTALFATEDQANGMASFVENGPGKATFEGR